MARDHLAPGGTFVMYNYYQPFLLDRYATALDEVFGSRPCVELGNTLSGRQQAVLTVAPRWRHPELLDVLERAAGGARSPTTAPSPTCRPPRSRTSTCWSWG